jgi:heme/copper-type cytochrome/quinol oxidase subunit 2
MHDELRAGIDRPRGRQYIVLVLVIVLLTIVAYFYRRSGPPRQLEADPVQGSTGVVTGIVVA